ncbi:MAG: cache domain-containing protein [Lentisphaeria bacterium]|nr:cache domain-containing protein [Lentisphaeria bacterium]
MPAASPALSPGYAPGLQSLLDAKVALLEGLARDPAIRSQVEAANRVHASLSAKELAGLDARWCQADGDDPPGRELLGNAAAQRLAEFRARNPGFPEIFLTDRQGLVVAMSNRTSDYLQADEDWWQQTYAGGKGHAFFGGIEYDASALSQAIALAVPIPAEPGRPVAGVIKALYEVDAIKAEL